MTMLNRIRKALRQPTYAETCEEAIKFIKAQLRKNDKFTQDIEGQIFDKTMKKFGLFGETVADLIRQAIKQNMVMIQAVCYGK